MERMEKSIRGNCSLRSNLNLIQYIKHREIDKVRWDAVIAASASKLPYGYSWYLDITAPNWEGLVYGDYQAVMPLTSRRKWGMNLLLQPLYTQQLGIFSSKPIQDETAGEFFSFIKSRYRLIVVNLNYSNPYENQLTGFEYKMQVSHNLSLDSDYSNLAANYSENHRRNIRKAEKEELQFVQLQSVDEYLKVFRDELSKRLSLIDSKNEAKMAHLMNSLMQKGYGELYGVTNQAGDLLSTMFILQSASVFIYLFASATKEGRALGASHFIVDRFIQDKSNSQTGLLDFEGSMIEGIARFYKGFGAIKTNYLQIRRNRLPWIIKWMK